MLLRGYAAGIFPMADSREAGDIFWVEPRSRAIIPLETFHLSRSLAKRVKSGRFAVTRDQAFHEVLLACADREETWINSVIERATLGLHAVGHAHSIECWHDGELVGGLYGVKLGRAFFGESMFSRMTDASKVALAWLVARLKVGHFTLLDCQFMTGHLASLGAVEISQEEYCALLGRAQTASPASGVGVGVGDGAAGAGALSLPAGFARLSGSGDSSPGKLISQLLTQTS